MSKKSIILAATLGTTLLGITVLSTTSAYAQSQTSGAIQGSVVDSKTNEKLPGVTVIATSPSLAQAQTAITDENGQYKITDLPPGDYLVTFYYADITLERGGVVVGIGKSTPVFQKLNQAQAGGEVVKITDTAPTINPTSTTQGITIDKNYIKNIPVPGRTFESTLGAAAGSQGDGLGVSFSGSSSLENQYYVDGVNTTGLTFGTVGSPVINDFIEEIEVITGGYNAEMGRATGGVVNVVTKSGSNEFKGSVFAYFQPGALTAAAERTPRNAATIDATSNLAYTGDFGFELGGPIIKDKLWFYVGFAPQFGKADVTRTTKRQTDCRRLGPDGKLTTCNAALIKPDGTGGNADGSPDVDPKTGFFVTDDLDTETRSNTSRGLNVLAKLNFAATPENQGQLTLQALPGQAEGPGIYGPSTSGYKSSQLTTDLSGKWTSKFNDNKTEIEAVVGWHRDKISDDPYDPAQADSPVQVLFGGSFGNIAPGFGAESQQTVNGCKDGDVTSSDPYPFLGDNCPMGNTPYVIGGPGSIQNDVEQRRAAKLSLTQRVKAAGSHEIRAGIDVEDNTSDKTRLYSGGRFIRNYISQGYILVDRWVTLLGKKGSPAAMNNTDPRYNDRCSTPDPDPNSMGGNVEFVCDYTSGVLGQPGTQITGNTFNWSAYLRDSWQIQPNLTLNAGIRYEEQRLRFADFLRNKTDALTGEELGKNAMSMKGMFAPRIGLLYDWTKEGRSKIYAHWGRFYESIPMDINDRSFGGEVSFRQQFAPSQCGAADPRIGGMTGQARNGENCPADMPAASEQLLGASGTLVAPGIKPQYLDEIIAGFEYEILDDLKIGVAYKNRRLGRVIEDVSTDGADTYIIANPGEWSSSEETKLVNRIARTDDVMEKARLENQLKLFQGIRVFDKPRRDYNSLEFTLTRRFSKKLYVQGSYTYSKAEGNYPGLVSYDNGQVDPNISSQYDLIELLANRVGPLPQDRPHYIKLDGYYTFDLKKAGNITVGTRLRALSGVPINALGGHYLYGPDESFLLPRGQIGRTDFEHSLDLRFIYARQLSKGMQIEFFVDLHNIYNRQGTAGVDNNYAPAVKLSAPNSSSGTGQNANPVSGGTYQDLIWVKTIDDNGNESGTPIGKNPNYRNTTGRYAPLNANFGMRLNF